MHNLMLLLPMEVVKLSLLKAPLSDLFSFALQDIGKVFFIRIV